MTAKLIYCHCRAWSFSWAVAELPMPMHEAAILMQRGSRCCPSCGDTQGALLGKAPAGSGDEQGKTE